MFVHDKLSEVDILRNRIIISHTTAWQLNDEAHRFHHFINVEACGNAINDRLGLNWNPKLIMMVAFFHDMFAWSRNNHHDMSHLWVLTTDHPVVASLDPIERNLVALGCQEHRASRTLPFTCQFTELMNAADRELPGRIEDMLERAIQYRLARGMDRDEALIPAIEHLKEKFGVKGYARYPDLYAQAFGDDLEKQRQDIMNL